MSTTKTSVIYVLRKHYLRQSRVLEIMSCMDTTSYNSLRDMKEALMSAGVPTKKIDVILNDLDFSSVRPKRLDR